MTLTLTSLLTELRNRLADTSTLFTDDVLNQAVRDALREWSRVAPAEHVGTITLAADGREIDLASLAQPPRVRRVWLPYTASSPEHPPAWRRFEQFSDAVLYIVGGSEPAAGDVARVFYHAPHTLEGLDGAAATTLRPDEAGVVVDGALSLAVDARRRALAEQLTLNPHTVRDLLQLALDWRARFEAALARRRQRPAGGYAIWRGNE